MPSKLSITSMRPPQQGHGVRRFAEEAGLGVSGGAEMAEHARLRVDAGLSVYFCDPHSPWQRGTNENTNGIPRQYFPKGTDLTLHDADTLPAAATALNARPRKTLGWGTPAETLGKLLKASKMDLLRRPIERVQYTSLTFGSRYKEAGVRPSMGSVGDAYDNAMAESFFSILERELLSRHSFSLQAEARMACFAYIEGFYNPLRLHSGLGYPSPADFERSFHHDRASPVTSLPEQVHWPSKTGQSQSHFGAPHPGGPPHIAHRRLTGPARRKRSLHHPAPSWTSRRRPPADATFRPRSAGRMTVRPA